MTWLIPLIPFLAMAAWCTLVVPAASREFRARSMYKIGNGMCLGYLMFFVIGGFIMENPDFYDIGSSTTVIEERVYEKKLHGEGSYIVIAGDDEEIVVTKKRRHIKEDKEYLKLLFLINRDNEIVSTIIDKRKVEK